jgi:hypothetical protein
VTRGLLPGLVFGEDVRDDDRIVSVEVAGGPEYAEEFVPVDVAFSDVEMLVHTGPVPGRVADVAQSVGSTMVERVGCVDRAEPGADLGQERGGSVAVVERVRADAEAEARTAEEAAQGTAQSEPWTTGSYGDDTPF